MLLHFYLTSLFFLPNFFKSEFYYLLTLTLWALLEQPSLLSMRTDVDILLHSLSSRHSVQPNALKVSATLFSYLKVSKALSASSLLQSFIVFTRCAVFLASPSSFTLFRQFLSNLSDLPTSSIVFLDKGEKWQT